MTLQKDTYCSYCGALYPASEYPKHCKKCKITIWSNPTPVVVALVPIDPRKIVIGWSIDTYLGIIRSANPCGGQAFPGGFIETNETWQEAAARELKEEIDLSLDPLEFREYKVISTESKILIFAKTDPIVIRSWNNFKPNREVIRVVPITKNSELCFPSHEAVRKELLNVHS